MLNLMSMTSYELGPADSRRRFYYLSRLSRTISFNSSKLISVETPSISSGDFSSSAGFTINVCPSLRLICTFPSSRASSSNLASFCRAWEYVYTFIVKPPIQLILIFLRLISSDCPGLGAAIDTAGHNPKHMHHTHKYYDYRLFQ